MVRFVQEILMYKRFYRQTVQIHKRSVCMAIDSNNRGYSFLEIAK